MSSYLRTLSSAFSCLAVLGLAGCGEGPQIREYVLKPETERIVTSDVLRSQFPVIPFRWAVPEKWRSAENDQFSLMAWAAGPKDSPEEARITISELPQSAGIEPQVARWRQQIGMDQAPEAELKKDVKQLAIGEESGSWIELQGAKETILGLILIADEKMWVLKYRSSNETARQQRAVFRGFCESLRVQKARRS